MEPKLITSLVGLSGTVIVWIIAGILWLKFKALYSNVKFLKNSIVFTMRVEMRFLGIFLAVGSIVVMAILSIWIPPENIKPGDWILALILGIFMSGFGSLCGVLMWLGRVHVSDHGVLGWSIFGLPRFVAWNDLNFVEFSGGMQSYKLISNNSEHVYVPEIIDRADEFIALLKKNVSSDCLEKNLGNNSDSYLAEKHVESMAKYAPLLSKLLVVIIPVSFLFLSPYAYSILISATAGIVLSMGTVSIAVIRPDLKDTSYSLFRFFGMFGFIVLLNISWSKLQEYLGGESNIDGYTWIPIFIQTLGTSMLFAFLTLMFVRWVFSGNQN